MSAHTNFSTAVADETFDLLLSSILNRFPCNLEDYSADRIPFSLLSRFLNFLKFLAYPTRDDVPRELDTCSVAIDIAPPVLAELEGMLDDPSMPTGDNEGSGMSPYKKKIRPSRSEKRSKAVYRATTEVDPKPFRVMDVQIPRSSTEAENLAAQILLDQKNILKVRASLV